MDSRGQLHSVVGDRLDDHETRVRKLELQMNTEEAPKAATEPTLKVQIYTLAMIGGFCGSAGGNSLRRGWSI